MGLNRQPQFTCRLDRSNPICKDIAFASTGDFTYDAASSSTALAKVVVSGSISGAVTRLGKGLAFTGASAVEGARAAARNGDLTVLFVGNPTSSLAIKKAFAQSGTAGKIWFAANTDENETGVAGQLTLGLLQTAVNRSSVKAAGAIDGTLSCYLIKKSAGAGAAFKNGVKLSSVITSTLAGSPTLTTDTISIGGITANSSFSFGSDLVLVLVFNRALSDAECASITANPWQVFANPQRTRKFFSVGGSGSTGTSATTNANDAPTASGTTTVTGTLAQTNANDAAAASGTTTVTGAVAYTNADDACAASGAVGSSISGSSATTNANDAAAAEGTTTVTGTLARSNANDAGSASGTTTVIGTSASTNANDVCTANGAAGTVSGTAACTNGNDTCAAVGVGPLSTGTSGGFYEVPHVGRRRSVKEERERLGIIPREVKQIVQAVARASVVADKTDDQAARQLAQRLAQQDIEAKARYVEFMQQERDRILSRDIERMLRIRQRQYEIDEDEREAEMLLM